MPKANKAMADSNAISIPSSVHISLWDLYVIEGSQSLRRRATADRLGSTRYSIAYLPPVGNNREDKATAPSVHHADGAVADINLTCTLYLLQYF